MNIVLEIRDLLICLDQRTVLDIEQMSVGMGEILAVIGPNGAGKSSLLLALARLIKPTRGSITFNGKDCSKGNDTHYRRHLGLVLQESLLLDASVHENVAIGLKFRHLPRLEIKTRVDTWLERFGIQHLCDRPANKLSGGEAQRVSLARAFALQPELLLLDEPFSALDSPSRTRLLEDLKTILAETGTTTMFITHDLAEAARLGDRMAVILGGRLHQQGTPQDIFSHPKDDEVRVFLGQFATVD
jgi:tungstate transport system ATP-binding protein